MQDRVSANPGRVLITPEDGSGAFYATLALADNPTVVGTPLNAANLLSQATAAALGLGPEAVPDAAFLALSEAVKLVPVAAYQITPETPMVAVDLLSLDAEKTYFVGVSFSEDTDATGTYAYLFGDNNWGYVTNLFLTSGNITVTSPGSSAFIGTAKGTGVLYPIYVDRTGSIYAATGLLSPASGRLMLNYITVPDTASLVFRVQVNNSGISGGSINVTLYQMG